LGDLEKEWGTGRSSTSGIVPYTRWRYLAVTRCWQLVMSSQRRSWPAIGYSGPALSVNADPIAAEA